MRLPRLLPALALLALAAMPAAAVDGTMALGTDGEVYRVLVGGYGSLVANAPAAQASNPVLVLERTVPGSSPTRILVPGTEDAFKRYAIAQGQREGQFKVIALTYRAKLGFDLDAHLERSET